MEELCPKTKPVVEDSTPEQFFDCALICFNRGRESGNVLCVWLGGNSCSIELSRGGGGGGKSVSPLSYPAVWSRRTNLLLGRLNSLS